MAVLRKNELRDMGAAEMREKVQELYSEIMSERAKISSGGLPDNPGKLNSMKKAIARIKTIAGEKGYKLDG
jgi:large subunit ribosomal protein L29